MFKGFAFSLEESSGLGAMLSAFQTKNISLNSLCLWKKSNIWLKNLFSAGEQRGILTQHVLGKLGQLHWFLRQQQSCLAPESCILNVLWGKCVQILWSPEVSFETGTLSVTLWKQYRGLSTLKVACSYQITVEGGPKSQIQARLQVLVPGHMPSSTQSHLQLSCLVLSVIFKPRLDIWEELDPGPPLTLRGSPHISPAGLELLLLWWGQMDVEWSKPTGLSQHEAQSSVELTLTNHGSQKLCSSAYYCVIFTEYVHVYIYIWECKFFDYTEH